MLLFHLKADISGRRSATATEWGKKVHIFSMKKCRCVLTPFALFDSKQVFFDWNFFDTWGGKTVDRKTGSRIFVLCSYFISINSKKPCGGVQRTSTAQELVGKMQLSSGVKKANSLVFNFPTILTAGRITKKVVRYFGSA